MKRLLLGPLLLVLLTGCQSPFVMGCKLRHKNQFGNKYSEDQVLSYCKCMEVQSEKTNEPGKGVYESFSKNCEQFLSF